jgi:hypothetical protein
VDADHQRQQEVDEAQPEQSLQQRRGLELQEMQAEHDGLAGRPIHRVQELGRNQVEEQRAARDDARRTQQERDPHAHARRAELERTDHHERGAAQRHAMRQQCFVRAAAAIEHHGAVRDRCGARRRDRDPQVFARARVEREDPRMEEGGVQTDDRGRRREEDLGPHPWLVGPRRDRLENRDPRGLWGYAAAP